PPASFSFLADSLLFAGYRDTRPPARAGVCVRPLPPGREIPAMPVSAVGADLDETTYVHLDVLAKVALDPAVIRDDLSDTRHFLFGKILDLRVELDGRT